MLITLGIAAFLTATLSAIIGMGGGVTLLGVMTIFLPVQQIVPIHGVVQLVSNSTRSLVFLPHVAWKIFLRFLPTMLIGMWLASLLWSGSKLEWLKVAIGVFLISFVVWHRVKRSLYNPPLWSYAALGLVAGFLGIFVGAVGPFLAPFFLRDDFDKEQVIATKAICQTAVHLTKIPVFFSVGFNYLEHWVLFAAMIPAVVIGTIFGKKILSRVSKKLFVMLFELALVVIGSYLIIAFY